MVNHGMGWKPDLPDVRDRYLRLSPHTLRSAAASSDLRPHMPAVYDQGQLGSCTANAIAGAMEYRRNVQGLHKYTPSRLFIYYNEREIEGTVDTDAGAMIRDGIKSVNADGAVAEEHWPYDVGKFAQKPPAECYAMSPYDAVLSYQRIDLAQRVDACRATLTDGFPVVFGFSVYESFESDAVAKTGIVPMPKTTESMLGGHAVLIAGHNDEKRLFLVRNSWGPGWGDGGYCWMSYDYIASGDLSDDYWAIDLIGHKR